MCEPVSACRALRISASRAAPGGSALAFSRSRFASWVSRTSSGEDWMILRRGAMVILQPMNSRPTYNDGSGSRKSGTCDRQNGEKRKLVMNDRVHREGLVFFLGPGLRTAFALENANYFTVLRVEHFQDGKRLPAALVAGLNRVGSKLENTSFLKSRSTAITTPSSDTKYHSAHSFSNWRSDIGWRWKRPRTSSRATTSKRWNTVTGPRRTANGRSENLAGWSMP
ncbi:hypothetical protein ACVWWR_007129 [Bradyrhizobium sp. LM3.2]